MMLKKVCCVAGMLLALVVSPAFAYTPNDYSCTGNGVSLSFTPGASGGPFTLSAGAEFNSLPVILTLKLGNKTYSANDSQIESVNTPMGQVKTILIPAPAEGAIQKASFILPKINVPLSGMVGFKTQLFLTTIAVADSAPGIVNKSNYANLTCKAGLVFN